MPPVGMHQSFGDFIDRTRKFRVHQQWQARPRNMGQSGFELLLGDHREAVDTWMNKKALEPQHSRRCERRDVVLIVVDNAAQSTRHRSRAAARFNSSPKTEVVAGRQFKGISTSKV